MRRALLFTLLISLLSFAAWNETLTVRVLDQGGLPVQDADVTVRFQKQSILSDTDGVISGKTDEAGEFTAQLADIISGEHEKRYYNILVSQYDWAYEFRKNISGLGKAEETVAAPLFLRDVVVSVSDRAGGPIPSVAVFAYSPFSAKRVTDSAGEASFHVPENTTFTAYATYGGATQYATAAPGTPTASRIGFVFDTKDNRLLLTLLSPSGEPLNNTVVAIAAPDEKNYTSSEAGTVDAQHLSSNNASVSFAYSSFRVSRDFRVGAFTNATFRVPQPPNVSLPDISKLSYNCFLISLNVHEAAGLDVSGRVDYIDKIGKSSTALDRDGDALSAEVCPYDGTELLISVRAVSGGTALVRSFNATIQGEEIIVEKPPGPEAPASPFRGAFCRASEKPNVQEIRLQFEQVAGLVGAIVALALLAIGVLMRRNIMYSARCAVRYVRERFKL